MYGLLDPGSALVLHRVHAPPAVTAFRPSKVRVARIFGFPTAVATVGLIVWWPLPVVVAVAAYLLMFGGLGGIVVGASLQVAATEDLVRVRTPWGVRDFPINESTAQIDHTVNFFGTKRFPFLLLQRRGARRYSVRLPLNEFDPVTRTRMTEAVCEVLRAP